MEFDRHGLSDFVTLQKRDVCLEGFGEELKHKVDAVFLDLPHPWLAIEHATVALKQIGKTFFKFNYLWKNINQYIIINIFL